MIVADKDDNKFVDCAVAANVNFIVTHDNHFNVLKDFEFPKLAAIDVSTFKNVLASIARE